MGEKELYLIHGFHSMYAEAQERYVDPTDSFDWEIIFVIKDPNSQKEFSCYIPQVLDSQLTELEIAPNTIHSINKPYKFLYYCNWAPKQNTMTRQQRLLEYTRVEEEEYGYFVKVLVNMGNDIMFYGYLPKEVLTEEPYENKKRKSRITQNNKGNGGKG